jgi:hypothetical protein
MWELEDLEKATRLQGLGFFLDVSDTELAETLYNKRVQDVQTISEGTQQDRT